MSGKALDTVHVKALEEVPEVMNGKALEMVPEMALEEVPEIKKWTVLDMVHVKVLEEVQGEMSKEVHDMAQEIILEMKLLNRKSSIIPLMKPDLRSEGYLVSELRPIHPKSSMELGMTRNIHGTTQLINSLRVLTLGGTLRNTETDRDGEAIKTGASIDAETEEVTLLIAEVTSEVPDASSESTNLHALLPSLVLLPLLFTTKNLSRRRKKRERTRKISLNLNPFLLLTTAPATVRENPNSSSLKL
jgi:hypothetical protein